MPKANMNRQLTTEEKEQIVKLYNDGMLPLDIIKKVKIRYSIVIDTLHDNGLHFYSKKVPKEMESVILDDYLIRNISPTNISDTYLIKRSSIMQLIKKEDVYKGNERLCSKEDVEYLKNHYPTDSWEDLFKHFPGKNKQAILAMASRLNIKRKFGVPDRWSEKDDKLLKETWNSGLSEEELVSLFGRTYRAISTRACKLNLKTSRIWTSDEDEIVKQNYNTLSIGEILDLLPNRTEGSVRERASVLGLCSEKAKPWTDKEDCFLIKNWQVLPDVAIGNYIGRSVQGVKERRHSLKLYRKDPNRKLSPKSLSRFLRGQTGEWKNKSMENCNWKCVITGSKDFEIHHLYGLSKIISDIMSKYNIQEKEIEEYTQDELIYIKQLFIEEQDKHPLGVCVRKDIHALFHKLYGKYYNTPEQWYQFRKDFCDGLYDDLLENKIA